MHSLEYRIHQFSESHPDKTALIDPKGVRISYSMLWEEIVNAAARLRELGLSEGDRIIVAASKELDFVFTYFGAHMEGIIVAPVDSEINETRLSKIYNSIKPRCIIGNLRHNTALQSLDFPDLRNIPLSPVKAFPLDFPRLENIADILFTTGTTGAPKGVCLSFANEAQAAFNINTFIGNTQADVELLALPVSHSFGLGRLRCMLSIGATVVILGSFASMKKFFGAIEDFDVTGFGMVPSSWQYIKKMSGNRIGNFASRLRYIEIGSAAMSLEDKLLLMELLPHTKICMHYGLTEASRSTFISFHDERPALCSAGKASPNCEIAIYSETGQKVPNGVEGEVCVKGLHVCSGYWNDSEGLFSDDCIDGFFRTGDWGFLDDDLYLHLKSRKKEMINVGGKKVSPMEVEEALLSIEGVREAACVGMADSVMGEVVVAFVVGDLSPADDADIISRLSGMLENYKVPVAINHVDSIPKTESGKIQRLKLKND